MKLREARPRDAEAIRPVHRAAITGLGPEAYDDEQVEGWARGVESADYSAIESEDYCFLVAEDGEDVVGFGSVRFEPPDDYEATIDAEVTAVYVHPSAARRESDRRFWNRWSSEHATRGSGRWVSRRR